MKATNSHCFCGLYTGYKMEKLNVIMPCEHIVHQKCFIKLQYKPKKQNAKLVCPICFTLIQNIIPEETITYLTKQGDVNAFEIWKDMNSMRFPDNGRQSKEMFFQRLPKIIHTIMQIKNTPEEEKNAIQLLCKTLCDQLNIHIEVIDKKLDIDIPKIYIANHSAYIDPFILNIILQCGFVGSGKLMSSNMFSDIIPKIARLIPIERSKKGEKTVDKMKEFIKQHKKLCIFPEGMMTALNTLAKFRTGAFYVGYPVQPVVIEYTNLDPHWDSVAGFAYRLIAQSLDKPITAKVTFLEIINPPFDVNYIVEKTRLDMAMIGNFYLSRVSNREIKD